MLMKKNNRILVIVSFPESATLLLQLAAWLGHYGNAAITVIYMPSSRIRGLRDSALTWDQLMDDHAIVNASNYYVTDSESAARLIQSQEPHDLWLMAWDPRIELRVQLAALAAEMGATAVIVRSRPPKALRSILVPIADGEHSVNAAHVADRLSQASGASAQVVHVLPSAAASTGREWDTLQEHFEARLSDAGIDMPVRLIMGNNVAEKIVDLTGQHDLVVLGGTNTDTLDHLFPGSLPEKVSRTAPRPALIVQAPAAKTVMAS